MRHKRPATNSARTCCGGRRRRMEASYPRG